MSDKFYRFEYVFKCSQCGAVSTLHTKALGIPVVPYCDGCNVVMKCTTNQPKHLIGGGGNEHNR